MDYQSTIYYIHCFFIHLLWNLNVLLIYQNAKFHSEYNIDVLVQDRCNSSALAMELRLSCTNPSICYNLCTALSLNWLRPSDAHMNQVIIWTNAGILLIGPLGTNFSEILIKIHTFSCIWKCRLVNKWQPFCLGLNVLTHYGLVLPHDVQN